MNGNIKLVCSNNISKQSVVKDFTNLSKSSCLDIFRSLINDNKENILFYSICHFLDGSFTYHCQFRDKKENGFEICDAKFTPILLNN